MDSDKKSLKDDLKKALEKRALGYDYEEKIVDAVKDGNDSTLGKAKVRIVKKHVPPDVRAIERIMEEMYMGRW